MAEGPTRRILYRMPSLGADMDKGEVVEWERSPGAKVARGDILLVVKADKGEIDVEVFEDCVLDEVLVTPGTEVAVGTPLAWLRVAGEGPDEELPRSGPTVEAEAAPREEAAPPRGEMPVGTGMRASPRARRLAKERGVDLAQVRGTGPAGAVTVHDVEAASAPPPAPPSAGSDSPTSGMRRAIAAAMSRSNRDIPHYYLSSQVDLEPALGWLEQRNATVAVEARVLPAALLLAATARAAKKVPALNGFWRDDSFVPGQGVQLGVAISLKGGGLFNPAIADADEKGIDELMAGLSDLVARARQGGLRASELSSPTLTVTNIGDGAVDEVFPVIQPPQVAIVGFGGISPRPAVVDGRVVVRRMVTACLAADHRVTDGAVGAKFLAALRKALMKPEALAQGG